MPELPEVETIVRDLQRLVLGATIAGAKVLRPDLIRGDLNELERGLADRRIDHVHRRAKNIVFTIGDDRLVINLGMTGRVVVGDADAADPPYLGVRFDLQDGRAILYQDVRRFGKLELVEGEAWQSRSAALGLEPLSDAFTPEALYRLSRNSKVAVKTWLMDQTRVVGVGNIYASEALFRAKLSPRKVARRLTRREAKALFAAVQEVLRDAIEFRGTTLLDYRDASGERGEFSRRLAVYDRKGEPCPTCTTPIRRFVQGGRSTFYCPRCQR